MSRRRRHSVISLIAALVTLNVSATARADSASRACTADDHTLNITF